MSYVHILLLSIILSTSPAMTAELVMFESEACEWCEVWDEEIGVAYDKTNEAVCFRLKINK